MRHCVLGGEKVHTSYVVDGGYLENTGLLTLTQVFDDLVPDVRRCNLAAARGAYEPGCPSRKGRLLPIEPWIVELENHYRSSAVPPEPGAPKEVLVPPATVFGKRGTTLGTIPLEQLASLIASRSYGGSVGVCQRFVRIAPQIDAAVQAPLGWALATSTRKSMNDDILEAMVANLPAHGSRIRDRC